MCSWALNIVGAVFFFLIIFLNVSLFNAGSRAGCSRFPGLFTISIFNRGMFLSSWWQCMY